MVRGEVDGMKIVFSLPMRNRQVVDVDAEFLFDLAPHLASVGTFAVHEKPLCKGIWNVSNIETGLWVGEGYSRADAIKHATLRLEKQTPESLKAAYLSAKRAHKLHWWLP
jgi:hypothetical protein